MVELGNLLSSLHYRGNVEGNVSRVKLPAVKNLGKPLIVAETPGGLACLVNIAGHELIYTMGRLLGSPFFRIDPELDITFGSCLCQRWPMSSFAVV